MSFCYSNLIRAMILTMAGGGSKGELIGGQDGWSSGSVDKGTKLNKV